MATHTDRQSWGDKIITFSTLASFRKKAHIEVLPMIPLLVKDR